MTARRVMVIGSHAKSLIDFRGALLQEYARRGCAVLAVGDRYEPEVTDRLRAWGVQYKAASLDRTGLSPANDFRYLLQLRQIMALFRPDIVVPYTQKPVIYGSIAAKTRKRNRCYPLITGLGYLFGGQTSLKVRLLRGTSLFVYRRVSKSWAGVLFQNSDDEAVFRSHGVVQPDIPTRVVPGSGVDLNEFQYAEPTAVPGPFLMCSRLLIQKGVRDYVEAARMLKGMAGVQFWLAGPIEGGVRWVRREEIAGWEAEKVIDYRGMSSDVRPWLAACMAYVLPSYYREGVPRGILEALAVGRAIITTDTPGCRDTVIGAGSPDSEGLREGQNGFLVPANSPSALARAMRRLIENPMLAVEMGRAGRKFAEERFDVKRVNAEILSFMNIAESESTDRGGEGQL